MTDRTTHPTNSADTSTNTGNDPLVQLYRQATAHDTGPSPAASARILARARQQAQAASANHTSQPAPVDTNTGTTHNARFNGEPANDHRWLRHALGSLAAIGLVGWLTLQHLNEPGAPQLDSPAPASATTEPTPPQAPEAAAPGTEASTPPVPASAPHSNAASQAAKALPTENALPSRQKQAVEHKQRAEAAIKLEALERVANATSAASAPSTATQAAPAPAPAPAQAARAAAGEPVAEAADQRSAPAQSRSAPPVRAASASNAASASGTAPMAERRTSDLASASADKAHAETHTEPRPAALPTCDDRLPPAALAEQTRRIQARDAAQAAGQPVPTPLPVCKPAAATPLAPAEPASTPQ